jgi:hypothetical protein
MSSDRNSGFSNLEDSALLEMATGYSVVDKEDAYEDMLIEKLALERIKSQIDKTTGAPADVRFSVGAAQSSEDKLATLQSFYPDAVRVEDLDPQNGAIEYGYGNFVFTNPETGVLTLYDEFNPKFLGMPIPTGRDFLDAGPEVAETVGTIGGLIGGGIAGAAAAPFTGGIINPFTGAIVGEGLGSATARELYIGIADVFGETVDTRSLGEQAVDFTQTATFNAAAGPIFSKTWQGIKYVSGQPIRYMTGGASPSANQTKEAFDSVGISNPTAGQITTNPTLNLVESSLSAMPTSTKIMHQNAAQTISELDIFARELAEKYGGIRTTDEAGLALMNSARAARQRFNNQVNVMYKNVNDVLSKDISSNAEHTQEFVKKYMTEAKTATGENRLKPVMELAAKVMKDADAGVLNFNTLKNFRTGLRENLSSATAAGGKLDATGAKMKELYGYITKDLDALVARSDNPDALKLYKEANDFVFKNTNKQGGITFIDSVLAKGDVTANKALKYVLTGAKDGGEDLLKLRNMLEPEEFNALSGYMLGRMGLPTPGIGQGVELGAEGVVKEGAEYIAEQGFSPKRFMTNWNSLSKEAKEALFKGTEYEDLVPDLDNLVFTIDKIGKAAESMANPSGTARVLNTSALFLSGIGGKVLVGSPSFEFGFGALIAPYASAKLMTNKTFVRWLTEGLEKSAYDPSSFGQHVRRLYQIYELNPEIRDEVRAILEGMQFETIEQIDDRNAANVAPVTTAAPNEGAFREVSNAEISGKLLPDVALVDDIQSFDVPTVSDASLAMSPTILPDEKDREIAMRQTPGGIAGLI